MSLKPTIPSVWLWINWLTWNGSCRNKLLETESLLWIFMVKMMKNVSLMQSRCCCQCVSRVSFLRTSCETEISAVNIITSSQVGDISRAALRLWYILNLSVPDTFETNPCLPLPPPLSLPSPSPRRTVWEEDEEEEELESPQSALERLRDASMKAWEEPL